MKYFNLGREKIASSRVILGCMRIADKPLKEVEQLLCAALESGVNTFDHADIYGGGESEKIFGEAVKNLGIARDKTVLQSKCAIRTTKRGAKAFDFSREYILSSVEGSLKRLQTDHLDTLLLHRPDALLDEHEVAEAFCALKKAGKVRAFGVSNFSAGQTRLLESAGVEIVANQLQFSLMHAGLVEAGFYVNMNNAEGINRDGEIYPYCRERGIAVQAWSPLYYGFFEGVFVGNEKFPELNKELERLAERYGCSSTAIAFAWILRLPAMQAVAGTTRAARIREIAKAADIQLTRDEWYELYAATGKILP
ncbi:MAG: aldo/keto reductase [Clostridia bacterium]|nr:aldo/keto reductase [Clostridia bacterium]